MRLTLRTLLAYMDDILDADDQEALTRKVESSEFASDLIHRTRDTMRRLRLGAPRVMGAGIGLDPNTVAEYLDNTLSAESIADFERVCLESDIHLAEAASCHHILTMILGEPAEIDPQLRTRMYAIAETAQHRKRHRLEGPHGGVEDRSATQPAVDVASDADELAESVATAPLEPTSRHVREVPDYLRAADRSWVGRLATLAAALLLMFVAGALALSLAGWVPEPLAWLNPQPPAPVAPDRSTADELAAGPSIDEATSELPESPSGPPEGVEVAPETGGLATREPFSQPGDATPPVDAATIPPTIPPSTPPVATSPDEILQEQTAPLAPAVAQPLAGGPILPSDPLPPETTGLISPRPSDQPTTVVPRTPPIDVTLPESATPASGLPPAAVPPPLPTAATGSPSDEAIPPAGGTSTVTAPGSLEEQPPLTPEAAAEADVAAPTEQPPSELGMYWDDRDLLLRNVPNEQTWIRLASRTPVEIDDQLLSLPTFRPNISLHSGLGLNLSGATLVTLGIAPAGDPADAIHVPSIKLIYGRLVAVNTSGQESPLQLVVGQMSVNVQLARNATLAVEAIRSHVAGRDPLAQPAPLRAVAYAPQGGVVWIAGDRTTTISAPSQWTIVDGGELDLAPLDDEIDWLAREPTQRLEERAAAEVRDQLQPGSLAGTALLELFYGSRRREVKSMAARCSVYVGEFGPFVDALDDSEQRAAWGTHIETLRSAMALSSTSAARIRESLVRQRGEEAAVDLFEMLRGYDLDAVGRTPEARQRGALEKLIDWLESDSLDYRVLAAHNLREITGKNLMPNPAGNPTERQQGVRRWRQRLRDGELEAVANNS